MTETKQAALVEVQENLPSSETVTPMTLVQMAVQQGSDVDRLSKLYELQVQWEKNESKKSFDNAMASFRSECPAIKKNKTVDFTSSKGRTNYKHADLSGALYQIQPIMSKYGLSHSWRTKQSNGMIEVECIVTHAKGHSESTSMIAPYDQSGNKNPIQAIGSATTYLQRYTLFSILGLASTDQDDDGAAAAGAMELVDVVTMMEGATTIAELDAVARNALKLNADDKAKARKIYEAQKKRIAG